VGELLACSEVMLRHLPDGTEKTTTKIGKSVAIASFLEGVILKRNFAL
jgi:hypothetical protein